MEGPSRSDPPESGPFPPSPIRGLVKEVLQDLALQDDDLLVDLSCGDGRFAEAILEEVGLQWQIIGVEASQELLLAGTCHVGIRPIPMDLEAFARFPVRYHKALLHPRLLRSDLPEGVFARLRHQLIPGGRLVVVGSTPGDDVPLPATARRRWELREPGPDAITAALEGAGFSTRARPVRITCHTPAAECLEWVAERAWPVLADAPDAEIDAGLVELREALGERPAVTWTVRFDLITGLKPGDPSPPRARGDGGEDGGSGSSAAR